MYYIFLIESLLLFLTNLVIFVFISQIFNFIKIKIRKLNLIIIIFFVFPILLFSISTILNLIKLETLFTYIVVNLAFVIIYPGLDHENIPSLKILSIVKKYEEKNNKPCPVETIKKELKPELIILKRINELKKDKFLKKNSFKLNLVGKVFVFIFSIIRMIYNVKGGKG